MPRGTITLLGAVVAAALVGVISMMATDQRRLAFTPGVQAMQVAASLEPRSEACQSPIAVSADASFVRFQVGTYRRPGQPLSVTARAASGRFVYGRGEVPGGYADNSTQRAAVGGLENGRTIALCIRNGGRHSVALYGAAPQAARTSELSLDGRAVPADLSLVFDRDRPRSALSLLPQVFERAALFHAGWLSAPVFWALAAVLCLLGPLLLAVALLEGPGTNERRNPSPEA